MTAFVMAKRPPQNQQQFRQKETLMTALIINICLFKGKPPRLYFVIYFHGRNHLKAAAILKQLLVCWWNFIILAVPHANFLENQGVAMANDASFVTSSTLVIQVGNRPSCSRGAIIRVLAQRKVLKKAALRHHPFNLGVAFGVLAPSDCLVCDLDVKRPTRKWYNSCVSGAGAEINQVMFLPMGYHLQISSRMSQILEHKADLSVYIFHFTNHLINLHSSEELRKFVFSLFL